MYYRRPFKFAVAKGYAKSNEITAYDAELLTYTVDGKEHLYDVVKIKDNSVLASRIAEIGTSRVNSELSSIGDNVSQSGADVNVNVRYSITPEQSALVDMTRTQVEVVDGDTLIADSIGNGVMRFNHATWETPSTEGGKSGREDTPSAELNTLPGQRSTLCVAVHIVYIVHLVYP